MAEPVAKLTCEYGDLSLHGPGQIWLYIYIYIYIYTCICVYIPIMEIGDKVLSSSLPGQLRGGPGGGQQPGKDSNMALSAYWPTEA